MIKIYHNSRCSKSRQTLELIQEAGETIEVMDYIKTPLTAAEIKELLRMLDMKPQELLRKGETVYKENYKGKELADEEWVEVMVQHPILIERPIVVKNNKAVLARPPEKVQELL